MGRRFWGPTKSAKACLCSLHWASTEPFVQSSPTSRRTNASSFSTMTSSSCCSRSALCVAFWRGSCGSTVASGSTGARLRFGIEVVSSPGHDALFAIARQDDPDADLFGLVITLHLSLNTVFVFWALLWAAMHSSGPNSKPLENPMSCCGVVFRRSRTSNLRGCSFSSVQAFRPFCPPA